MKQGVSQIRNPVIARVFRELALIEQWGSGIPSIFREAKASGLAEPKILEIGSLIRVVIYLSKPQPVKRDKSRKSSKYVSDHESTKLLSGAQSKAQSGAQPGAQSNMMLVALTEKILSAAELLSALGLKTKIGSFKRTIKDLLDQKFIEYTFPDNPKSRLQKYRITVKGRDLLAAKHTKKR